MNALPPSATAVSRQPAGRYRYVIAFLLLCAATINYIDRQSFAIAERSLSKEFNFSPQEYGTIAGRFLLAYALGQILTGWLVDRFGARKSFSVAIVGWSLFNMAHAMGRGVLSFSFLRFGLGLFEAANYPAALKAIASWFPKQERSTAVGWVNAGVGLGAIVAGPFVAQLVIGFGWRGAFLLTGALGFVWLAFWLVLFREPEAHASLGQAEREFILLNRGDVTSGPRSSMLTLLRRVDTWALMASRFVADGAFYFFATWLPKYLGDVRGLGLAQIGWLVTIPFIAADLGSFAGGFIGTALIRRGVSIDRSRKLLMWAGALLVPFSLLALRAGTALEALLWIGVGMFGIQVKSASLFTVPADVFGAQDVALGWGLTGAAGSYGGSLFVPFVGWLVANYSYTPVFLIVSIMHIVSCLIVMIFLPKIGAIRPVAH